MSNKRIKNGNSRPLPINRKLSSHSASDSADSQDEEVALRVGRIPLEWYDQFRHLGYDVKAQRIEKKKQGNS